MPSTPTISLSDYVLNSNETALVTISFEGSYADVLPGQLISPDGSFSTPETDDEGLTWTATFTPRAGVSTTNSVITLDSSVNGGASSSAFTVDTVAPSVTISIDDANLTTSEKATVTVAFSERMTGMGTFNPQNGALSTFTTDDEGLTWRAKFTPNAGVDSPNNDLAYSTGGVTDLAGNALAYQNVHYSGFNDNNYYAINTTGPAPRPTATILVDDDLLIAGETTGVTITFSEAVRDFDNSDVSVGYGTLSTLSSDDEGLTWHGTLTPTNNVQLSGTTISVNLAGVTGKTSELAGTGSAISSSYRIDTILPTATIAVANESMTLSENSLVTITFNEAVQGLTKADFQVEGGSLTDPVVSDEGIGKVWTATFSPVPGIDGGDKHIKLNAGGVLDYSGNPNPGGTQSNAYIVDTVAPTATLTISDKTLTKGDTTTVTVTFSEKVDGMAEFKLDAPNGVLSAFTNTVEGKTWTATFTPDEDITSADNTLTLNGGGIYDEAGNAFDHAISLDGHYAIDTTDSLAAPTATIVVDESALNRNSSAGVTITFSEAVRDFDGDDVTVGSGTLVGLSSDDEGKTWHGTLGAEDGVETTGNTVSVDLSGVTGYSSKLTGTGKATSNVYSVDTKGPSATVVVEDTALSAGEISLVTVTFSERVISFNPIYLNAQNGTVGPLTTSDEGLTWTATLTPKANVSDSSNQVSVNVGALVDMAGNIGTGIVMSNNYSVDTAPPVVVIPTPTPTPTVTVDGVSIKNGSGTTADGSKSQIITVPTVTTGRVDKDGTAALADIPLVKGSNGNALLSVGVPVGFGLKASGSTTPKDAGDSLANLIAEIKAHTVSGSQAQQSMTGGGSGFLDGLDAGTPLLVQTIVATAPKGADVSTGALVISGATGTDTPQTALVIDTKGLPSGATIELQNVEFAAVIGNVTLRGGEGRQVVYGDSDAQNIMLGADDDVLHGGAGNDIVGSAGGNDQIFGDEGDDIVFGGEGDDLIDGGTGYDIVRLAGAGRDEYSLRVADGKLVMTHLDGGIDGTDIVSNVEALRFAGATVDFAFRDTDVASLVRMYDTIFDRHADEDGLNFWIGCSEAGMSLHDIAVAMATSEEAQARYQGMSDAAFIQALYLQGLDRSATAEESKLWIESLENGVVSRGDALLGFADSAEKIALVGVMDTSITTI